MGKAMMKLSHTSGRRIILTDAQTLRNVPEVPRAGPLEQRRDRPFNALCQLTDCRAFVPAQHTTWVTPFITCYLPDEPVL